MKKTFFYIFFLILTPTIFFSCGEDQDADLNDPTVVSFWHFWSEPYQKEALDKIIEDFEKKNNCTVKTTELSWNDGKTKLLAAFNSGTAPDVLELGSDWIAQFSSAGVLKNLNNSGYDISSFIDFSTKPSYWKDSLYAIPWVVDTRVLFINNSLLKKIGWKGDIQNFEQVLQASSKINGFEGNYGWGANGSDPHRLYKKILPFFWSNNGQVLTPDYSPVINSQENVNALEFYITLSQNGLMETQRHLDALFAQGKLGFWMSGSWLVDKIQNENSDLDYKVITIPNLNGNKGVSFAGGEYLAVNTNTRKNDLAKKLILYLTSGENALTFAKNNPSAGFPANRQFYNDSTLTSQKFKDVFARQLESSNMTPVHPKWLDIEEALENSVVEALYGTYSPQEALNRAQARAQAILR